MKRYRILQTASVWTVETNASSMAVAIARAAKILIEKHRKVTGEPVKSISLTCFELYPVKKEYYIVDRPDLGVFDSRSAAGIAGLNITGDYRVKERYVERIKG